MAKLNMTRPEFLTKFLTGEIDDIEELQKIIPDASDRVHCCYSMLKPFDFDNKTILSATYDKDVSAIGIQMSSKTFPKTLKEEYHKTMCTVGDRHFKVKVKAKDSYVIFIITPIDLEDDDDEDSDEE